MSVPGKILLFKNRTIADAWCKEISCTPSGVWLWLGKPIDPNADPFVELVGDPDGVPNVITYAESVDGQCAIGHPWGQEDWDFFIDYCSSIISTGDLQLLDALPNGWEGVDSG